MRVRGFSSIVLLILLFSTGLSATGKKAGRKERREAARLVKESRGQDDVRAVLTLLTAVKTDPNSVSAFYRLGFLHHKMNRRVPALRYYGRTIKLRRCHGKALNNMAGILLDSKKAKRAEELYRRAIRCRTRIHAPYYNLALILQERGDVKGAARYYRRTLKLKPDHHRSHHNLGLLYARAKRPAQVRRGIFHLRKACALNPRDPLNHFSLGRGLYDQGDFTAARKSFHAALARSGRGASIRRDILRYLQAMDGK